MQVIVMVVEMFIKHSAMAHAPVMLVEKLVCKSVSIDCIQVSLRDGVVILSVKADVAVQLIHLSSSVGNKHFEKHVNGYINNAVVSQIISWNDMKANYI